MLDAAMVMMISVLGPYLVAGLKPETLAVGGAVILVRTPLVAVRPGLVLIAAALTACSGPG